MDLKAVRAAIAEVTKTVTPAINAFGFAPSSIVAPCFFTGETDIEYDKTYGRGMDEFLVTCYILVGSAFDESSQDLLDGYLKGSGPTSLKAAIEGTPGIAQDLGGECDDLHVVRVQGYRSYNIANKEYAGAELVVRVIGSGS